VLDFLELSRPTRFSEPADPAVPVRRSMLAGPASRGRADVPVSEPARVALLSDGAARAIDLFQLTDRVRVIELLTESGPPALLARVRAAERSDSGATCWPRHKFSDDATAGYCDTLHECECGSP